MASIISLTEAKQYLQITNTISDALISLYIDQIESEISAYINQPVAINTYTEFPVYLNSNFDASEYTYFEANVDYPRLYLKNTPIKAISIVQSGATITNYNVNTATGVIKSDYFIDQPTVTYVAGYTTVTAPTNLKLVAMQGVKSIFSENSAAVAGEGDVKSKKIGDFSVSYGDGYVANVNNQMMSKYLAANQLILNKYRRVNV